MARFGEAGEETIPLIENEEQTDWDEYEAMEMQDLSTVPVPSGLPFEDLDEMDEFIITGRRNKDDFLPDRKSIAPLLEKMYPNANVEGLNLYTRPLTGDAYWWNGEAYIKVLNTDSVAVGKPDLTTIFVQKMEEGGYGMPLEEYIPQGIKDLRKFVKMEEQLQEARMDLQRERQVLRQSQTLSEQAASRESINQIEERIQEIESERDEAEAQLPLRTRVRAILTRYKYGVGGFVVAAGLVAGIIVVSTKNAVGSVMSAAGNGLTKLGQTAAKQLPAIVGAVAGFVLRAAGNAIAFLGKNAWLVLLGIAAMAVNGLASSSGRSETQHRRPPH